MHIRDPLPGALAEQILDAFPSAVFLMDDRLRVLGYNQAAEALVGTVQDLLLEQFCGNILRCLNEHESAEPCGMTSYCSQCEIRAAVDTCWELGRTFRRRHEFKRRLPDGTRETLHLRITASNLHAEGRKLAVLVLEDVSEITRLQRLLPICASCKKIRDDEDAWHDVAHYVTEHTDIQFTHGLCKECAEAALAAMDRETPVKK